MVQLLDFTSPPRSSRRPFHSIMSVRSTRVCFISSPNLLSVQFSISGQNPKEQIRANQANGESVYRRGVWRKCVACCSIANNCTNCIIHNAIYYQIKVLDPAGDAAMVNDRARVAAETAASESAGHIVDIVVVSKGGRPPQRRRSSKITHKLQGIARHFHKNILSTGMAR